MRWYESLSVCPVRQHRPGLCFRASDLWFFPPEISCGETLPTGPQPFLLPTPIRPHTTFPRDIVDFIEWGVPCAAFRFQIGKIRSEKMERGGQCASYEYVFGHGEPNKYQWIIETFFDMRGQPEVLTFYQSWVIFRLWIQRGGFLTWWWVMASNLPHTRPCMRSRGHPKGCVLPQMSELIDFAWVGVWWC